MDCSGYRELISAQLDGETSDLEDAALAAHLRGCRGCSGFQVDARGLQAMRIAASPPVPDQTTAIVRAMRTPARSLGWDLLRGLVAALGLARIAGALGMFLAGGARPHASVELAAAELAVGVGLLIVAIRPSLAPGLVAMLTVLAAATVIGGAGDVMAGRVSWHHELLHVLDAVAAFVVWRLSVRSRTWRGIAVPA